MTNIQEKTPVCNPVMVARDLLFNCRDECDRINSLLRLYLYARDQTDKHVLNGADHVLGDIMDEFSGVMSTVNQAFCLINGEVCDG